MSLDKINKSPSDFAGQEPDFDERLDYYDPKNNHNKFWHIQVYGRYVVRRWGRHGSKGQSSVHSAPSCYHARDEANKLYWQKRDKGYVKDQTTVLDHIARKLD